MNNANNNNKKKKTRYNPLLLPCAVLLLTTIVSIVLCIVAFNKKAHTEVVSEAEPSDTVTIPETKTYSEDELIEMISTASANAASEEHNKIMSDIKDKMSKPNPNISAFLRDSYPDNIVYYTSEGYRFDDISTSIPRNQYKRDDFTKDEDGFITYNGDNADQYLFGIDVSQHQGKVDWEKVASAGVQFAIIRVGFRGYGSGKLVLDEQFEDNIEGALQNKIPVGVYFFSQAVNEEEQLEEVEFIMEAIAPYKITYPVIIDIEKPDDSSARGNSISRELRTDLVKKFCKEVELCGYTPMIYGNTYSLFSMLDMESLYEYPVWFAFYDDYIYYPYELNMWQYSDTLSIPGIKGTADIDILIPQN